MPGNNILEMRHITIEFPGVKALDDVTLNVKEGEIHAICGENGAGKSTLMKILSGVHPHGAYTGDVVYKGETCAFKNIKDSEAKGIVIIHQELMLSPYLSIAENIFLGNERKNKLGIIDWGKTQGQAKQLMDRVGLDVDPNLRVFDVGVGKQQLAEICKALSKNVQLLILDEPTAALNDDDSEHLLELIRQLKKEGVTSIMISHKLSELLEIADTITVIRDGQTISTLDNRDKQVTEGDLIKDMVGRTMDDRYPVHPANKPGEELFRVENWNVFHPVDTERQLIFDANIELHAGEIVGLAGLMGAGRTELCMSLFGHMYGAKISGKVYHHGKPINTDSVANCIANGITYATEDRKKFGISPIRSVRENMTRAGIKKLSRMGVIDASQEINDATKLRQELTVKTPTIEEPISKLSGGNQQKALLAKWVYAEPDVMILDEPTRGIDVGAKYEIYEIIDQLADQGKAVLMISSELPEILGVCDRIYTLSDGVITGNVPRAEATQESLMALMTQERNVGAR
ncbi:MAG: sugar ABC transporter ATP-binding protein [Bifidobacteriaceae bacterium]|jgi:putative multiple sugar transport system ATP-binding protein|nr:sugar ABC transporter ATP-binding protein [Bifidobacteriaceae bacterium]